PRSCGARYVFQRFPSARYCQTIARSLVAGSIPRYAINRSRAANLIARLNPMAKSFLNIYSHGFARVAVGVPRCKVADPAHNAAATIALARQAAENGAALIAFPELGLPA